MESSVQISDLFNVDGLVAVITGGGTGSHSLPFERARAENTLANGLCISRNH